MRDPESWIGLWPKDTRDRMALGAVLLIPPFGFAFETVFVMPYYVVAFSKEYYACCLIFLILLTNFVGNLYKLITVDPSGRKSDLPSVLRPEWRYCYICQLNSPPRAHHCPVCDLCILKRDHHCSFAGTCVGYHNHRYFVVGLIYGWLVSVLALWWHWSYIWESLGGMRLGSAWFVVMPHLALITLQIGPVNFILAGILMSSVVCLGLSSYLLALQIYFISRGQTRQEGRQGIRGNDLGLMQNWKEVLGQYWLLACLFPFLPSPLPGNGLRFPRKTEFENVKDL